MRLGCGAPLHKRLAELEIQFEELTADLQQATIELRGEITKVRVDAEAGVSARGKEIADATRKLEGFAVGGLHIEWLGLAWLLAGTLYCNIPEEIAAIWTYLMG